MQSVANDSMNYHLQKEKCIIDEENKYSALEKKARHIESQVKAYENSSENEVVNRLHYEVADVEQRVKSRNLEIQILERRVSLHHVNALWSIGIMYLALSLDFHSNTNELVF